MTDAKWFKDVIDEEWDETDNPLGLPQDHRTGRPAPTVLEEGNEERRALQFDTQDVIWVKDGGDVELRPASVSYRDEHVVARIHLELTTSDGRKALTGEVDRIYDGMEGEVRRIVHKYRKGMNGNSTLADPGYDLLTLNVWEDLIGESRAGLWSGQYTIEFTNFARPIHQPAMRP